MVSFAAEVFPVSPGAVAGAEFAGSQSAGAREVRQVAGNTVDGLPDAGRRNISILLAEYPGSPVTFEAGVLPPQGNDGIAIVAVISFLADAVQEDERVAEAVLGSSGYSVSFSNSYQGFSPRIVGSKVSNPAMAAGSVK